MSVEIVNLDSPFKVFCPFSTQKEELFETVCYKDGEFLFLEYHQKRVDKTFATLFGKKSSFDLSKALKNEHFFKKGVYRVKIVYNSLGIKEISFYPYKKKKIKQLALVEIGEYDYSFKYSDRRFFNFLYTQYSGIDEFILLKNGYLSDFTIGNIALFNKNSWYTPTDFLLEGTVLKRLIEKKRIVFQKIHFSHLKNFSKIALTNALVGFYSL